MNNDIIDNNSPKAIQTLILSMLLAISGGLMDAYSFLFRGKVFANAQTGNILLTGVYCAEGEWKKALTYLIPVLAFSLGIIISLYIRKAINKESFFQKVVILIEILILFFVAFIPQKINALANSMISLACGIQLESFRNIRHHKVATTMCIGNLKSALEFGFEWRKTKSKQALQSMIIYLLVIFAFIIGAIIGSVFIKLINIYAIWICAFILLICEIYLFLPYSDEQ